MTDYMQWKVADLKAELKRRGIPQTGLRVKQNFIDRLLEEDAKGEQGSAEEAAPPAQDAGEKEENAEEKDDHAQPPSNDAPAQTQDSRPDEPVEEQQQKQQESTEGSALNETREDSGAGEQTKNAEVSVEEPSEQRSDESPAQQPQQEEPTKDEKEATEAEVPAPIADTTIEAPDSKPEAQNEAAAEPVEQAPEDAAAQEPTPGISKDADSARPVGKDVPSAPNASEVTTELSTPLPMEEVIEDTRKRKRRSQSPIPTPEALANKKIRARSQSPKVLLKEDVGAADAPQIDTAQDDVPNAEPQEEQHEDREPQEVPQKGHVETQDNERRPSISEDLRAKKAAPPSSKQDARFKGLFAAGDREPLRPASPPADTVMVDVEVEPALHVATAALYIDGLMRPLQPAALRNHLISLAAAPGASPNPDVLLGFYLDPIKTHCLASFTNVSAASRVRSALHATVWPNERNRKVLFVDFVPEDKLQEWINTEEDSRRRGGPAPRWAVKYEPTDDGVEAVLQEVDPRASGPNQARNRDLDAPPPVPTGPRGSFADRDRRPSGPAATEPRSRPGQGFKPLDDLFSSTTTKPKLYYLPVPREVADKRLDRFDDLVRKGSYPRRGGDEMRRISFEDTDLFVDKGPEYGNRNNRRRRRGRGGFGDSWRG